jgi:hypothetical protein
MSDIGSRFFQCVDRPVAGQGILPRLPATTIPSTRTHHVTRRRRSAAMALIVLLTTVAMAGCGGDAASPSAPAGSAKATPSAAGSGMAMTDLSVVGCAADDPTDEGELTGAWAGNDTGVYYIRQVGDCVWWFGTEVRDIELGPTSQRGFASVASGRIVGTQVDLEWVDVPLGYTVNGGGLTFIYDKERGELTLAEQRGGRLPFGGTVLTRIEPDATSSATPSATPTP